MNLRCVRAGEIDKPLSPLRRQRHRFIENLMDFLLQFG